VLDDTRKYVASRTLKEPLPWCNSTLLAGDVTEAVAELKARPGACRRLLSRRGGGTPNTRFRRLSTAISDGNRRTGTSSALPS